MSQMTTDNKRPQNLGEAIRKLMSKTPLLRVVVAMGLGIVGFEHLPSVPTGVLYGILAGVVVGMAYIALGKRQMAEWAFTAMLWVGFASLGMLLCSHYRAETESGLPDGGWGNEGRGQAVFVARLDDTPHQRLTKFRHGWNRLQKRVSVMRLDDASCYTLSRIAVRRG